MGKDKPRQYVSKQSYKPVGYPGNRLDEGLQALAHQVSRSETLGEAENKKRLTPIIIQPQRQGWRHKNQAKELGGSENT